MTEKNEPAKYRPQYAGLARRFLALGADFIFLGLLFFPVTRVVKGVWVMSEADHLWSYGWLVTDPLCVIFLSVLVFYFILLEGLFGETIGKRICGVKVVDTGGGSPGIKRAAIRNLFRIIDALPAFNILGVYLIVSSPQKARFGDRIANTRVIIR